MAGNIKLKHFLAAVLTFVALAAGMGGWALGQLESTREPVRYEVGVLPSGPDERGAAADGAGEGLNPPSTLAQRAMTERAERRWAPMPTLRSPANPAMREPTSSTRLGTESLASPTAPPEPGDTSPGLEPPVESLALSNLAAQADEPAPAGTGATMQKRPWDDLLLARVGKSLGTDKLKDVTKGRSYKVNLYQDAGEPAMNRAKVDIDRDDRWDEKWTFKADGITLQVAPADDEVYSLRWYWTGVDWAADVGSADP